MIPRITYMALEAAKLIIITNPYDIVTIFIKP